MKTFAVIVTYSDRYNLLEKVIDSCLHEGVEKIIVVDNNSAKSSKESLKELESKLNDKLSVVYLDENIGSAGGYKRGLEEASSDNDCEFIWMLDDDNMPQKGSLNILSDFWDQLEVDDKSSNIALLSYRNDRKTYLRAILENSPSIMLGEKNSFLGFHVYCKMKNLLYKTFFSQKNTKKNADKKHGTIIVAPYGGLFFHKDLLKKIGLPDESYFVYADDYDFSYRITKSGGKIYLLLESKITDLEESFHLKNRFFSSRTTNAKNEIQSYYMTRNNIKFEKNFVDKYSLYYINAFIYFILNSIMLLFNFSKKNIINYKAFLFGMKDGLFDRKQK